MLAHWTVQIVEIDACAVPARFYELFYARVMEHVLAIKLHTWLLAEARGVADGAQFFLVLCASANLFSRLGDALRLEARKALAFTIDASAVMAARQNLVA